jgi:hypothetical protein
VTPLTIRAHKDVHGFPCWAVCRADTGEVLAIFATYARAAAVLVE